MSEPQAAGVGRFPPTSTRAELAALFGVSVKTIGTLIGRGIVIPTGKRSEYETVSSLHNYLDDLRKTAGGRTNDAELGAERLRIVTVERKLAEMKLAETERALVAVEEVAQAWSEAAALMRQRVLIIPTTARNLIPQLGAHGQNTLKELVRDTLQECADELHAMADRAEHCDPKQILPPAEDSKEQPRRRKPRPKAA